MANNTMLLNLFACCSQGVAILNQCQHWLRCLFLEEQQSLIIIHLFIEVKVQFKTKCTSRTVGTSSTKSFDPLKLLSSHLQWKRAQSPPSLRTRPPEIRKRVWEIGWGGSVPNGMYGICNFQPSMNQIRTQLCPNKFSCLQIPLFSVSLNYTSVLQFVLPINTHKNSIMNQSEAFWAHGILPPQPISQTLFQIFRGSGSETSPLPGHQIVIVASLP